MTLALEPNRTGASEGIAGVLRRGRAVPPGYVASLTLRNTRGIDILVPIETPLSRLAYRLRHPGTQTQVDA